MKKLTTGKNMGIGLTHGTNNEKGKQMKKMDHAKRLMLFLALLLPVLLAGCGHNGGVGQWDAPSLKAIAVAPANQSIPAAVNLQYTATGIISDGTSTDLTASAIWTSSDQTIATITNRGVATGISVGTTVITATSGGKTISTNLTVTSATLKSIVVTPALPGTFIGLTTQFAALGIFSDGSSHDLTGTANWTASDATMASLSADGPATGGLATALKASSPIITASSAGKTGSATLVISGAGISSITVTPATLGIVKGLTGKFTAVGAYIGGGSADVTALATWTSSDTTVASMSVDGATGGVATGVKAGISNITATFNGKSAFSVLTVRAPALSSIAVSPITKNILAAQTTQLAAIGLYDDGTTADLTGSAIWASGSPLVATMNPNGLSNSGVATGVAVGTSAITATFGGKTGNSTINVTSGVLALNPTAPPLGETGRFVILASQAVTTTVAPVSKISDGDIAIIDLVRSSYAGFTSVGVNPNLGGFAELTNGWSYAPDDLSPPFKTAPNAFAAPNLPYASIGAFITQIRTDLGIAYSFLAADPNPSAPTQVCPIELGNRTLTRGVYKTASNVTITTGTLHLDAQNDPNSVWIFTIDGTLTTGAPGGSISLENGAKASNVYWRTAGETVIGTNTNFSGNVFAHTQVRVLTGASVVGRLFGQIGQVTLDANQITKAP